MKTYEGDHVDGKVYTAINGKRIAELPLCLHLRNHSPTGFAWGYGGSGPSQLALAILADCVGAKEAMAWYQGFKWRAISSLPRDEDFTISEQQVRDVLQVLKLEAEQGPRP